MPDTRAKEKAPLSEDSRANLNNNRPINQTGQQVERNY